MQDTTNELLARLDYAGETNFKETQDSLGSTSNESSSNLCHFCQQCFYQMHFYEEPVGVQI